MGIADGSTGFLSKAISFVLAAVRALLLLCAGLLLFIAVLAAIIATSARFSLLNENFYLDQMDNAQVYDAVKAIAIDSLAKTATKDIANSTLRLSLEEEVRIELANDLPISWFRSETRRIFSNAFAYIKSETSQITLTLSITALKPGLKQAAKNLLPKFMGSPAASVAGSKLLTTSNAQPEQANDLAESADKTPQANEPAFEPIQNATIAGLPSSEVLSQYASAELMQQINQVDLAILSQVCLDVSSCITFCSQDLEGQPAEVIEECAKVNTIVEAAKAEYLNSTGTQISPAAVENITQSITALEQSAAMSTFIESQVDALPDNYDLDQMSQQSISKSLYSIREPVSQFLLACDLVIVACIILLMLQCIIAFELHAALRHVGWPFLLAGAAGLLLSAFGPKMAIDAASQFMAANATGSLAQATNILISLLNSMLSALANNIMLLSGIIGITGLAGIYLSFMLPKEDAKKPSVDEQQNEKTGYPDN
ncbi:MAG: hypothetical protein WC408_01100 [Candidatus Micrarchaeia archaeon]|jgi:hypothetical protein